MFKKSFIFFQALCIFTINAQDVKLPAQQISPEPSLQKEKEVVTPKKESLITPTPSTTQQASPAKPTAPKTTAKAAATPQKKVIKVTEKQIQPPAKKKTCPPHHKSKPLVTKPTAKKSCELTPIDANAPVRKVTIKNCLTKAEITYKHWSGRHTPVFKMFVNGKELNMDQQTTLDIQNNRIIVQYDFDFAKGYYRDSRKVELSVPQGNSFDLHFSWKSQPNFTISKCN